MARTRDNQTVIGGKRKATSIATGIAEIFQDKDVIGKMERGEYDNKGGRFFVDATINQMSRGTIRDLDQLRQKLQQETGRHYYFNEIGPGDYLRELGSGLFFGFADDIEAMVRLGDTEKNLQKIQQERKKFQTDFPATATGLELAGAVAPALIPGAGPVATAFRTGLNPGFAAGKALGNVATKMMTPQTASSFGSRAIAGGTLAAQGGLEGAITEAGSQDLAANALRGMSKDELIDALSNIAITAGFSAAGGMAASALSSRVAEYLRRKVPKKQAGAKANLERKLGRLDEQELRMTAELLDGRKLTPQMLRDTLAEFESQNKGDIVSFYDLVQRNLKSNPLERDTQIGIGVSGGSDAFEQILQRQKSNLTKDRVSADVKQTIGQMGEEELPRDRFQRFKKFKQREKTGSKLAAPLYREADPQDVQITENIANLLEDPIARKAFNLRTNDRRLRSVVEEPNRTKRISPATSLPVTNQRINPRSITNPTVSDIARSAATPGMYNRPTTIKFRTLDQLKRDIRETQRLVDRGLERKASPLTKKGQSDLNTIVNRAMEDAFTQVPVGRKASQLFGSTRGVQAFKDGKKLMRKDIDEGELEEFYDKLKSNNEKTAFKSGVLAAVINRFMASTAKMGDTTKSFRDTIAMNKLAEIFDPAELDQLTRRLDLESTMAETGAIKPGSPTAPIQQKMMQNVASTPIRSVASPTGAIDVAERATKDMANTALQNQRQLDALDLASRQAQRYLRMGNPQLRQMLNDYELMTLRRAQEQAAAEPGRRVGIGLTGAGVGLFD